MVHLISCAFQGCTELVGGKCLKGSGQCPRRYKELTWHTQDKLDSTVGFGKLFFFLKKEEPDTKFPLWKQKKQLLEEVLLCPPLTLSWAWRVGFTCQQVFLHQGCLHFCLCNTGENIFCGTTDFIPKDISKLNWLGYLLKVPVHFSPLL